MTMSGRAAAESRRAVLQKVLLNISGGLLVSSLPVLVWWKWATDERHSLAEDIRTRVRLPPGVQSPHDRLIETKVLPGDVILFDRHCERCAASPWAAFACIMGRYFLCDHQSISTNAGHFDHIGVVVPGFVKTKADALDPSNLLLLEATPSGVVARNLRARLDHTQSRSMILVQLCCPGETRNATTSKNDVSNKAQSAAAIQRTRNNIDRKLALARDQWIQASEEAGYHRMHSTITLGGAFIYGLGLQDYSSGPVSPAAFLVVQALAQAAAVQSISDQENMRVKPEDFLRDYRFQEANTVRLRPGYRFLAPITMVTR